MEDFNIKIHKESAFSRFINKLKSIFVKPENQKKIIDFAENNETDNQNAETADIPAENMPNEDGFRIIIKNGGVNQNSETGNLLKRTNPKKIIFTEFNDENDQNIRKSSPKKCPLCGTHESIYQRVILKENGRWKCAVCDHIW